MAALKFSFLLILLSASILEFSLAHRGFTTNLIRRDYPHKSISSDSDDDLSSSKSKYYNWISQSVDSSLARASYLNNIVTQKRSSEPSKVIEAPVTGVGGAYVMEVGIGTPPVKVVAIADTGSDVAWTQCKPCTDCYTQDDPLFDPKKTSTYRQLSCESKACEALSQSGSSCDESNKCTYQVSYGDQSHTSGDLAVDTFTFQSSDGKNASFPRTVFGCGHDNSGTFNGTESGIIGLGNGPLSIVNQFSSTISKKFSYCLVPHTKSSSSKISFGIDALPRGSKAVSTPLLKGRIDTFYFLSLERVTVRKGSNDSDTHSYNLDTFAPRRRSPPPSSSEPEGNIIIDSGTTLNFLPDDIYEPLKTSLLDAISAPPSSSSQLDLCFAAGPDDKFPDLVFHFTGADVVVPQENAFIELSEGEVCLAMVPSQGNIAIYGNLAQMNFLVEYDIDNEKLSFLPTDCSKEE